MGAGRRCHFLRPSSLGTICTRSPIPGWWGVGQGSRVGTEGPRALAPRNKAPAQVGAQGLAETWARGGPGPGRDLVEQQSPGRHLFLLFTEASFGRRARRHRKSSCR